MGYDGTVNIGFGPLSKILKFNLDIWNITVIISILFGVALIIFLIKMEISEKNLFKFSLLLSPSFIFLFDTMNLDIAIFFSISHVHTYFLKSWNITFLTIFSIFSMLKLYPLGFIIEFLFIIS